MTDSESECGPFKLVSYQKSAKKRTEQEESLEAKNQFKTSICIIYKKPTKHSTQVHIAANMNELISTMTKHNPMLSVLSFDHKLTYHPTNNKFLPNKDKF